MLDWSEWIEQGNGATIDSVVHSVALFDSLDALGPSDLTIEEEDYEGTNTVCWLSGGVVGKTYVVTARVTDNNSPIQRIDDRSFTVMIAER